MYQTQRNLYSKPLNVIRSLQNEESQRVPHEMGIITWLRFFRLSDLGIGYSPRRVRRLRSR